MLPTVRAHGLEGFLFGNIPCPAQFCDSTSINNNGETQVTQGMNPEFTLWTRHDQFLMSWLLSLMTESMLGHVIRCRIAADIWRTLEQLFNTNSKARLLQLRFLLQITKKGAMSIEEYMLKMKNIIESLLVVGQVILMKN